MEALKNLDNEWAVVYRENDKTLTRAFLSRDDMVSFLEKAHVNPAIAIVAVLKNGIPRNMKVKVKVQFR